VFAPVNESVSSSGSERAALSERSEADRRVALEQYRTGSKEASNGDQ
jgi:hypothetical protein